MGVAALGSFRGCRPKHARGTLIKHVEAELPSGFLVSGTQSWRHLHCVCPSASYYPGATTLAIEEPKYTVFLHDGDCEIRDYQAAVAAEVTVVGDQHAAARKGFRLLAGYIFGGNTRRQSIPMTAPVAQERANEKIAMTAPVTQTQANGAWKVRFTMPSVYSLATLPEPNDPKVRLMTLAPARFAVVRFSGTARKENVEANTEKLIAFAKAHHLRMIGSASLAQYNPPWTLWFLRRNEVLIPVDH